MPAVQGDCADGLWREWVMMTLAKYVVRVARRPWPWVLRYLLTAAPAAALGLLFASSLGQWFRLPLFAEALDSRSFDGLIEVLMVRSDGESPGPWLGIALLLLPIVWAVIRLVGAWLEGGILVTYALQKAPSWRGFVRASARTVGSFLLLATLGASAVAVLMGGTVGLALLGRTVWRPLGSAIAVVGLGVVFGVSAWVRLARASIAVREDGNVLRALRDAGRVVVHRPLAFLALVVGALALRVLLTLLGGALGGWVPLRAWLLTLAVQQLVQIAVVGVGLARRAAEVGLVQLVTPSAQGAPERPPALPPRVQAMPDA